jgi:hypothetical protein
MIDGRCPRASNGSGPRSRRLRGPRDYEFAAEASPGHARPLYFTVATSQDTETIGAVAPRLSVLADRDDCVAAGRNAFSAA